MSPSSNLANKTTLATPLRIKLLIYTASLSLIVLGWKSLIYIALHETLAFFFIALFIFINPYLHEKCHAKAYNILTSEKAVCTFATCKLRVPCTVAVYRIILLAPIVIIALYGLLLTVFIWFDFPVIAVKLLTIAILIAFPGMGGDFYWFYLLRKTPPSYLVIDNGKSADVFAN